MRSRILFLLAVVMVLASCGNGDDVTGGSRPHHDANINDTPRDDGEAEEAALWLSGDLVAPQDLYDTIHDDLAAIRGEYRPTIPSAANAFIAPCVVTELIVLPDDETWNKIRNGEPNAVDSLNTVFHATSLDSLVVSRTYAVIGFKGRLHPERLADIYAAQAGVVNAQPNGRCCDWSNVYPWERDGVMTYLFRNGYGDCPAGCINSDFWYFRRHNGQTEFVGTYSTENDPSPPAWWDEAKVAYYTFRGFPMN
jgi:hypothetical protein